MSPGRYVASSSGKYRQWREGTRRRRHRVTRWSAASGAKNRGPWQFYSADLSGLTVPPGWSRCQARKRRRVDSTGLPARVETRTILAKGSIGILRRHVSWARVRGFDTFPASHQLPVMVHCAKKGQNLRATENPTPENLPTKAREALQLPSYQEKTVVGTGRIDSLRR